MVLISFYTLAGFYVCYPLQCFPLISIYNFHISKITLLSFFISIYHIFHIFHRLDRFSDSSFPMSSLPASPRYFFQSVSSCLPCPSVITFSQFGATYFTHVMYISCLIPNFLLVFFSLLLFFQFPFFLSIDSKFPYRLSILGVTFKM